MRSDLFDHRDLAHGSFDLVISNPPYIRTGDISGLSPEVRSEPLTALDGGKDGFVFYRAIISGAHDYLPHGGVLMMEMGFDQAEDVRKIIEASKKYNVIEVIRDYNNIQRIIVAQKA
ncbi:MAG: hypothetical protein MUC52_02345 [Candidatus Omnitrophica bacterium]|nr:hypothetical protein [Candidatus Omnitrophota bacterium]